MARTKEKNNEYMKIWRRRPENAERYKAYERERYYKRKELIESEKSNKEGSSGRDIQTC